MPEDAFALEARLLQSTLLREVLDVGARLETFDERVGEQVLRDGKLGRSAQTSTAVRRKQRDPDVEGSRGAGWTVLHGEPAHRPGHRTRFVLNDQGAGSVADHAVGGKASLETVGGREAEEPELIVVRGAHPELRQIIGTNGS